MSARMHLLGGGEFGVLVPPGDPAALAGGISRLLGDPAAAARLATAARRHVHEFYSRDAMRRRFEDFYERLAA